MSNLQIKPILTAFGRGKVRLTGTTDLDQPVVDHAFRISSHNRYGLRVEIGYVATDYESQQPMYFDLEIDYNIETGELELFSITNQGIPF